MFCFQCQEAARGTGCTLKGVCGKDSRTAAAMDLLLFVVRGVSVVADELRIHGHEIAPETNRFIVDSLFSTITNANFDEESICRRIDHGLTLRDNLINEAQRFDLALPAVDELTWRGKRTDYEAKAATWSDSIRSSKEKELTDIQTRIQEFSQSVDLELQQQQQSLMAPIYEKARNVVSQLAKEGSYVYVFDINSVLYYDAAQSTDLTPAARTAMNIPEGRTLETLQAELQAQAEQAQQ